MANLQPAFSLTALRHEQEKAQEQHTSLLSNERNEQWNSNGGGWNIKVPQFGFGKRSFLAGGDAAGDNGGRGFGAVPKLFWQTC